MDGAWTPWRDATVHVLSHGLHYGTGVFEGIRCYDTDDGPAIFRLRDHLERLLFSARCLQMPTPYTVPDLVDACVGTIARNGFTNAYLRPILYYGVGPLGFSLEANPVHAAVAAWPWGAYLGDEGLRLGIRVRTSTWQKTSTNSVPSAAKICGNYVNSVLAFREAKRAGYDEALLLTENGMVAEGSGENVFIIKDGVVLTPPPSDHLLPGITRDTVIRLARADGNPVEERSLSRAELLQADEVFLTGTAAEVTPVRQVDDHAIGNGARGPLTRRLQERYFGLVTGRDARHADWLHRVRPLVSALNGGV